MIAIKGSSSWRLETSPRNGHLGFSERSCPDVPALVDNGFRSSGLGSCSTSVLRDLAFLRQQNEDTGPLVTYRHHLGGVLRRDWGKKNTRSKVILLQRLRLMQWGSKTLM